MKPWVGVALSLFCPLVVVAADWRPVADDKEFVVILNHDSVRVLPKVMDGVDLVYADWSRIYKEPIQLPNGGPSVQHMLFSVSFVCGSQYGMVGVNSSRAMTHDFKVVVETSSPDFPFSKDIRSPESIQGMDSVKDYVCSRMSLWRIVR